MLPNVLFLILVAASVRTVRDVEWFALVNLYGALVYTTVVSLFFRVGDDGRLGGLIFYDANDFALVMVCTIPFAIYFLGKGHKRSRRIAALVTLAMILTAMVKSGSRGGFIGLIAVMLYVLLRYRAIPSRVRLAVTIAGVALFLGFASDKYWTLMGSILHPQSDYNYNDNVGRVEVWKRGLGYMIHNPVVGVGVGAYPMAEGRSRSRDERSRRRGRDSSGRSHTIPFSRPARSSAFPARSCSSRCSSSPRYGLTRLSPRGKWAPWISRREMALAQMLIGAILGFAVAGFFVSAEYFAYLYFILGLAVGLMKLVRMRAGAFPLDSPADQRPSRDRARRRPPMRISAGCAARSSRRLAAQPRSADDRTVTRTSWIFAGISRARSSTVLCGAAFRAPCAGNVAATCSSSPITTSFPTTAHLPAIARCTFRSRASPSSSMRSYADARRHFARARACGTRGRARPQPCSPSMMPMRAR